METSHRLGTLGVGKDFPGISDPSAGCGLSQFTSRWAATRLSGAFNSIPVGPEADTTGRDIILTSTGPVLAWHESIRLIYAVDSDRALRSEHPLQTYQRLSLFMRRWWCFVE